jgi:hypothetical protein
VRNAFVLIFVVMGLSTVHAQQQEQRLVDRLLKPDTTLGNNAQDKKFVAKSKKIEQQAPVKSFYVADKPQTKSFARQRDYSATEFAAHHFRDGELNATMQGRAQRVNTFVVDGATGTLVVRDVTDGKKKIASSEFEGERPFLDQGKSQKALSQHGTPLTIEQVRELLNKNK